MTPSNIIQEDLSHSRSIGPGDRLQAARTKMGFSIEDVATRMHLNIAILESIEDNNFDDITAPIFVKGYLRAYARIVSLDEDEMIQQYQNYYSEEDPPIASTSNLAPEISSDDARIKWTTYLVIIGLLGLLAAWWWNQYQIKTDVVSLDAEPVDTMQLPEAIADSPTDELEPVGNAIINTVEEIEISIVPLEQAETSEDLTAMVEVQEEASSEPELALIEAVIQPADEEVAAETVVENELAPVAEEISRIAPEGTDQFKIVVHAETWLDIKDANGYGLARELFRADQTLNVTGKAPFAVFLGNGHGVEVIYDDEPIDISGRIRENNTARIKIGNS
jgi:cytoskeleton protein RodZ